MPVKTQEMDGIQPANISKKTQEERLAKVGAQDVAAWPTEIMLTVISAMAPQ